MAKRSSGKTAIVVALVLALVAGAVAWGMLQNSKPAPEEKTKLEDDPNREMTEDEREAYLAEHGKLENLEVVPDVRSDTNERVPGLLRVKGTLVNAGPRKLHHAVLSIYPKDEAGKVIGSFVEDVAKKGGPMAPGQARDFSFTIPEKQDYAGEFSHSLR